MGMGKSARYLFMAAVMLSGVSAYGAEYAHPRLLATPADVEKNAGKWIVLDCRDVQTTTDKKTGAALKGYGDGHIPGAITLGGDCGKVLREEPDNAFKDTTRYEKILGDAGIRNDRTVVIYGDIPRVTHAAVAFWIFEYIGQKDVRFLNGGIEAWEAEGRKLETTEAKFPAAKYTVRESKSKIATSEEVLKIAKGEVKGPQIVDSRTGAEYKGTDVRAKRGGHLPNCFLNVSHTELYDKATGRIKPMDELEKLYGTLDRNKRVIAYCQTGTRSTLTYLVFRLMGFKNPANYDDSWIVWGNREDLPAEK